MKKLASRGLGKVADSGQSPGGLSSGDLLGFNQFLDQHDSGVAARLDDAVDEQSPASGNIKINLLMLHMSFTQHLHSGVVKGLDFLPQGFKFIQREHGQNATNDGQTLNVVLFGIGGLLQILGDGTESSDDVLVQSRDGDGALDVSVNQVGLNGAA